MIPQAPRDPRSIWSDAKACAQAMCRSTGYTRQYWRMCVRSFLFELRDALRRSRRQLWYSAPSRGEELRSEEPRR